MRAWDSFEHSPSDSGEVVPIAPVVAPNYGVIRAHRDLPLGFLPDGMDGRWYEIGDIPVKMGDHWVIALHEREIRDDGVRATVYEVQP